MKLFRSLQSRIVVSVSLILVISIWCIVQFSGTPSIKHASQIVSERSEPKAPVPHKFASSIRQNPNANAPARNNKPNSAIVPTLASVNPSGNPVSSPKAIGRAIYNNVKAAVQLARNGSGGPMKGLPRGIGSRVASPNQQKAIDAMLDRLGDDATLHMDNITGTIRYLEGDLEALAGDSDAYQSAKRRNDFNGMSLALLNEIQPVINLRDPANELQVQEEMQDRLGMAHVRYQQTYKGIPVYGAQLSVHYSKENKPIQISGVYSRTPVFPTLNDPITEMQALISAKSVVAMNGDGLKTPTVKDSIYWDTNHAPANTYLVELIPALNRHWMIFVSKSDGRIVHRLQAACSQAVTGQSPDLDGQLQQFSAWQDGNTLYMIDTSQPMYRTNSRPPDLNRTFGDISIIDAENAEFGSRSQFPIETGNSLTDWDPTAVNVLHNFDIVEDYYRSTFNRNSINGHGSSIRAIIHAVFDDGTGQLTTDNAFWTSGLQMMVFGDGASVFSDLPKSLDVAAHELTHGVVDFTARLRYENQSGAINEHIADFFGAMVDRDEWLIGDGVVVRGLALRDMQNPGNINVSSPQPSTYSNYNNLPNTPEGDNGGVHINSGILNRMSYLLSDGPQGIGREKAEQLIYRALTIYMVQSTNFLEYRRAVLSAARDLYGDGSPEEQAVAAAFDAVEIFDNGDIPEQDTPTQGQVTQGDDYYAFMIGIPDPDIENDPSIVTSVIDDSGFYPYGFFAYQLVISDGTNINALSNVPARYTRPAFSGDGSLALFLSINRNLILLTFNSEDTIEQSRTLRTVAMSKDGRFIAYTTFKVDPDTGEFETTPDGYLIHDERIFILDIAQPTFEEGYRETVLNYTQTDGNQTQLDYADILSFNFQGDTLVYDAPQTFIQENGEKVDVWGIYSLRLADLVSRQIIVLSPGEQLGNPFYSNTSRNNMLLDRISGFGNEAVYDMVALDLESNVVSTVANDLGQAGEPTYRGNDHEFMYKTFSVDNGFEFTQSELADDHVTRITDNDHSIFNTGFLQPAGYPFGFRIGEFESQSGTISTAGELDFGDLPVNEKETIPVSIENAGNGDLEIYEITIEGQNAGSFSHKGFNQVIPPGEIVTIPVTFKPQLEGSLSAELKIGSTDIDNSEVSVVLNGVGTQQTQPPSPTPAPTSIGNSTDQTPTPVMPGMTPTPRPAPNEVLVYDFDGSDLAASGWAVIPGGFTGQAPGDVDVTTIDNSQFDSSQDGRGLRFAVEPTEVGFAYAVEPFLTGGNPVLMTAWVRASDPNAAMSLVAVKGNLATAEVDGSLATLQPANAASAVDAEKKIVLLYEPDSGDSITPVLQVAATGDTGEVVVWVDRLELHVLSEGQSFDASLFRSNGRASNNGSAFSQ